MFDIITIGTATRDVFLESKDFKFIESDSFSGGVGECLSLGSKNEVGNIFFSTGGGATNAAVTFSRLGLKTATIARVGEDASGEEILKTLKNEKVDTRLVEYDSTLGTAYSTLLMHGPGERTILVYRGASVKLSLDSGNLLKRNFDQGQFRFDKINAKWLYVTSLGGRLDLIKKIWQFAKKRGINIAWNPGGEELKHGLPKLAPFIKQCVVFNINREEAARLTTCEPQDEACFVGKLQDLSAITLVTDGKHGAYCYLNKQKKIFPELVEGSNSFFVSSLGTKPRNTTGAGDAFGSGFVAGLILASHSPSLRVRRGGRGNLLSLLSSRAKRGDLPALSSVEYALKLATLNADSVIQHMGAKTGILTKLPSKKQLDRLKIKEL